MQSIAPAKRLCRTVGREAVRGSGVGTTETLTGDDGTDSVASAHSVRSEIRRLPLSLHPVILCSQKVNGCLQEMNTPAPLKLKIDLPKDKIADFCRRWKISEFALFGSVLRDDFRPDSDIDVLVTFASDARWGLFALYEMEQELKKIFGREVDLVSRRGIEASRNYIRRKAILRSAEVVYVTGLRNILVHEYDDVDLTIVWDAVQADLPPLIAALEKIVPPEPPQSGA